MYTQASCLGLCSDSSELSLYILFHLAPPLPGGEDEGDREGLCSQDPQQVGDAQETSGQHHSHSTFSTAPIPTPHLALVSFPYCPCS